MGLYIYVISKRQIICAFQIRSPRSRKRQIARTFQSSANRSKIEKIKDMDKSK